ncbi:hypothetical protein [Hyphomonas sp. CACIAM 19H1]|uniref:hypothetical protein n=1 Tax=Hyphomonas sp. CACIAM 19H1 TaxID=1873716 RepID=UPI0013B059FB|nr:hypothetical protein [Hyphomonas sp. CACIAM 19H1]
MYRRLLTEVRASKKGGMVFLLTVSTSYPAAATRPAASFTGGGGAFLYLKVNQGKK